MAKTTRAGKAQLSQLAREVAKPITQAVARSIRDAAIEITNALVEAGPAWSGEFSASWDVVPKGTKPNPRKVEGRLYSYTYKNFPLKRFENAIENGITKFEVTNTAPHASIALDREESYYYHPDKEPLKDPVDIGYRPYDRDDGQQASLRWQIGAYPAYDGQEPNAFITAPEDWFDTYVEGGGLQRDLKRGVEIGFRAPD